MNIESNLSVTSSYSPNGITQSATTDSPGVKVKKAIDSASSSQMADMARVSTEQKNQEHNVIEAIEKANKHIKVYDRKLEFSIHEGTKQIMVKVINTENDSVIREIPSEKILDMVAHLWEVAGVLVDEKR